MDSLNKIFKFKIISDDVYFKITFLLWGLLHSLTVGQYVTGYLSVIIIVWGGLVIINKILFNKTLFNNYLILIGAFLGSYIITILINRELNFLANTKTLIWAAIMMIALFFNDFKEDKDKIFKDICRISRMVIIFTLIISFISLIMFFFNINFWMERIGGTLIPQGYYAARLWGIYVDPNQSCNIAIVSMLLSVIVYIKNMMVNKKILIINIVVQYLLLVLAGSRGGEIGFIFALVGLLYLVFEYLSKNRIRVMTLRAVVSVVLSIMLTFGVLGTFKMTREALAIIPSLTYRTQQNADNGQTKPKEPIKITTERPDVNNEDVSNGRIELWIDTLKLSKYAPIFGFGDRNFMIMADRLTPGSSISKQYSHNGFLHMLISGGVVAVAIMMTLIGRIAIIAIKKIMSKEKYSDEYYIYSIIAIMIGSILLTTVFLTEIFYQNSFTATVFWIFMGYLVYFNKVEKFTSK